MRCERCGSWMNESNRESVLGGLISIYRCPGCSRKIRDRGGGSLISSLLNGHDNNSGHDGRKAEPVQFSSGGRR